MYKVFYNQKPLLFTTNLSNNSDETPLLFIKYTSALVIIKAIRNKNTKAVYLYHPKEEKLEKHFLKYFLVVEAAGGLVEHTDGRYLFIYRNGKWDLPKGKIEKNEVVLRLQITLLRSKRVQNRQNRSYAALFSAMSKLGVFFEKSYVSKELFFPNVR